MNLKTFQVPAKYLCRIQVAAYSACIGFCILGIATGCAHRKAAAQAYPYREPLSSPGQKLGGLPPAVQKSIRAQVGGADIYDVEKLPVPGGTAYKVVFQDPRMFPPLYIKADGSVLYPDLTHVAVGASTDEIGALSGGAESGLRLSDLPKKVVSTIQEKAPTAEVAYINRVEVNDRGYYEVTFKDPNRNPKLIVAEDGTLVNKSGETVIRSFNPKP
ncbi:MAG TPA: hypothetical protein VK327_18455 [Candidatus Paceibacterota bacterium]|nr:hypothetical protein [Candidatus Paceibacterota bacterium]